MAAEMSIEDRVEYEAWLETIDGPAAGETACTHSIDCGCRDCEATDWYALGRALAARRYPTTGEDDLPF